MIKCLEARWSVAPSLSAFFIANFGLGALIFNLLYEEDPVIEIKTIIPTRNGAILWTKSVFAPNGGQCKMPKIFHIHQPIVLRVV